MTYTHFFNCALLTFGPIVVTYQASKLKTTAALLPCIYAGLIFSLAQFIKLFLVATFVPSLDETADEIFVFSQELMLTYITAIDAICLYIIFNSRFISFRGAVDPKLKILAVALGWAGAESLTRRLAPLWFGARATEFNWEYLLISFEGTLSLVYYIAFGTFAWLWTRKDLAKNLRPIPLTFLVFFCFFSSVFKFLDIVSGFSRANVLLMKAVVIGVLYFIGTLLFAQYEKERKLKKVN